jgi:hypothetical protein
MKAMTRDELGKLYGKAKIVEKALDFYKDALKVAAQSGPVDIGDGKAYRLSQAHRDVITNVQGAWKHLTQKEGFTADDMAKVCSLSKTGIQQVVASRFAKGQRGVGQAKAEVIDNLKAEGFAASVPFTRGGVVKK